MGRIYRHPISSGALNFIEGECSGHLEVVLLSNTDESNQQDCRHQSKGNPSRPLLIDFMNWACMNACLHNCANNPAISGAYLLAESC
jgi:hypothetical protein